jgi:hypothetical protein
LVTVAALALGLSGCSTSPPAASVNGQVITQGQLDQELQWWASSPAYVRSYDATSEAEQYKVEGTGSSTYSLWWTDEQLAYILQAAAVQQYLGRRGLVPGATELAAAWATEAAVRPQVWQQLPGQLRSTVAMRDAEYALVEKPLNSTSTEEEFYRSNKSQFWSSVCLRVQNSPSSAKQAASAAGWASYCLTPEQLMNRSVAFRQQVETLAPGSTATVRGSHGHEMVQVRSRAEIPFDQAVADDINAAEVGVTDRMGNIGTYLQVAVKDAPVASILKTAHVEIDPQYGTWLMVHSTSATGAEGPSAPVLWPAGVQPPS